MQESTWQCTVVLVLHTFLLVRMARYREKLESVTVVFVPLNYLLYHGVLPYSICRKALKKNGRRIKCIQNDVKKSALHVVISLYEQYLPFSSVFISNKTLSLKVLWCRFYLVWLLFWIPSLHGPSFFLMFFCNFIYCGDLLFACN